MQPPAEEFLPLAVPGGATTFACPLCGGRFTHGEKVCTSCPLNAGCDLVRCPHCGYQYPRSSLLLRWAHRLLGGRREEERG